jgi:hypothetical protein
MKVMFKMKSAREYILEIFVLVRSETVFIPSALKILMTRIKKMVTVQVVLYGC